MKDLALVFLTFDNREDLLLRSLSYYKNQPCVIYIVDASSRRIKLDRLKSALESTRFFYIHLPGSTVGNRLIHAANIVKEEYVALHCDDEFYLHGSLLASLSFLRQEIDYVSCMGFAVGFKENERNVAFYEVYLELQGLDLSLEDPIERAHLLARRYTCSSIYAVNRTSHWAKAARLAGYLWNGSKIFAIGEYLFELTMAIEGKRKILDRPHWLRNLGPSAAKYSDLIVSQAWFLSEYKKDRERIVAYLAFHIQNSLGIPSADASLVSREIFETFVLRNLRSSFSDYSDLISMKMAVRNNWPRAYKMLATLFNSLKMLTGFKQRGKKLIFQPLIEIQGKKRLMGLQDCPVCSYDDELYSFRDFLTHYTD